MRELLEGADALVHLVAIIVEKGDQSFARVNHQGTAAAVEAAEKAGMKRFLHMSALGAHSDPRFPYLHSKWLGEEAVRASGLDWTIFRPSALFGRGAGFFKPLKDLARFPLYPVVGSGRTRFQPIDVDDVVRCVMLAAERPETSRRTYDLGGSEAFTFDQIVEEVLGVLGKRRVRVHIPVWLARPPAWLMGKLLSNPPVTAQQLDMLALDNACEEPDTVMRHFGFEPKSLREGLLEMWGRE
jgi:NADH dehydrogenase